jgi:hypothetical protein
MMKIGNGDVNGGVKAGGDKRRQTWRVCCGARHVLFWYVRVLLAHQRLRASRITLTARITSRRGGAPRRALFILRACLAPSARLRMRAVRLRTLSRCTLLRARILFARIFLCAQQAK